MKTASLWSSICLALACTARAPLDLAAALRLVSAKTGLTGVVLTETTPRHFVGTGHDTAGNVFTIDVRQDGDLVRWTASSSTAAAGAASTGVMVGTTTGW